MTVSGIYLSGAQWNPEKGLVDTACGEICNKMPGMAWSFSEVVKYMQYSYVTVMYLNSVFR